MQSFFAKTFFSHRVLLKILDFSVLSTRYCAIRKCIPHLLWSDRSFLHHLGSFQTIYDDGVWLVLFDIRTNDIPFKFQIDDDLFRWRLRSNRINFEKTICINYYNSLIFHWWTNNGNPSLLLNYRFGRHFNHSATNLFLLLPTLCPHAFLANVGLCLHNHLEFADCPFFLNDSFISEGVSWMQWFERPLKY